MIDRRTLMLFQPYNREVGTPWRQRIHTADQFTEFVRLHNGVTPDVFVSVYDMSCTIDKIFLDFDGEGSLDTLTRLLRYLHDIGEHPYVTFSGRKGYHLWLPLRSPQRVVSSQDLTHATLSILSEAGVIDKLGRPIDPVIIGDIKRMARVPNTLRPPENRYWCTEERIRLWAQAPHYYTDLTRSRRTVLDLQTVPLEELRQYITRTAYRTQQYSVGSVGVIHPTYNTDPYRESLVRWFSPFMSKRVARSIVYMPEPAHRDRFVAARALLEVGFPPEVVVEKFRQCGWVDFDPDTTMYFLRNIDQKYVDRLWYVNKREVKR